MNKLKMFAVAAAVLPIACHDSSPTDPPIDQGPPVQLPVLGSGTVRERYTAEVATRGNFVYTSTWSFRSGASGNAIKVWNAAGAAPVLVDSLIITSANTTGDLQISDDGRLLVVAVESNPNGAIEIFDLTDPAHPAPVRRFTTTDIARGVHTLKLSRINNRLYAFLSIDPSGLNAARLVIVDITTPSAPVQVFMKEMGLPYVHDVFVRDGILFTALWNAGLTIWDVGGAGRGGTPAAPVQLGNVKTVNGQVHNVHWFHDPRTDSKKYAFIGEEGFPSGSLGSPGSSSGDIHVVDVSNFNVPREVAFFHVDSAGVHNFSVDEPSGILYAAFYNGGVRALDIRGELDTCAANEKAGDGRCNLALMKRERGRALNDRPPVAIWGVAVNGNALYASDMLNGLWKIDITSLRRN